MGAEGQVQVSRVGKESDQSLVFKGNLIRDMGLNEELTDLVLPPHSVGAWLTLQPPNSTHT